MYKNILIISDNLYLCEKLKVIFDNKLQGSQTVTFSTSPYSDTEQFSKTLRLAVSQYDLKNGKTISEIINTYDLVISIHCKQLFPPQLVNQVKCINIHPGYNPINRGWYPQVFAIIDGIPVGATIHEMDEHLDHGPIIAQDYVSYDCVDTSLTLYNKILDKEIELFEQNIEQILQGEYSTVTPTEEGNLYLKKDFNRLCDIDRSKQATYGEVIDHLRALSHGDYKNAYFIDSITKEKIYISIDLEREKNKSS